MTDSTIIPDEWNKKLLAAAAIEENIHTLAKLLLKTRTNMDNLSFDPRICYKIKLNGISCSEKQQIFGNQEQRGISLPTPEL